MAASEQRPRASTDNLAGSKPKIDVICVLQSGADVGYLVRVYEDFGSRITYHVKRMLDFVALNEKLHSQTKDDVKKKKSSVLKTVPHLPEAGSRVGVRRRLSGVGLSSFLDTQRVGLQAYVVSLAQQLPSLSASTHVQEFFAAEGPAEKDMEIQAKLLSMAYQAPTLASVQGHWKIEGNVSHIWTMNNRGHVLLDGVNPGIEYFVQELGQGADRVMTRGDGWCIDVARSDTDTLYWLKPDEPHLDDVVWTREADPAATQVIRRNSQNADIAQASSIREALEKAQLAAQADLEDSQEEAFDDDKAVAA